MEEVQEEQTLAPEPEASAETKDEPAVSTFSYSDQLFSE